MADRTDDAGQGDVGSEASAPAEPAQRPSSSGLPRIGDVVAGRYRIEREVGHGGMAVVYAATQLTGGSRQVALKWLFEGRSHRDERRRRFLREARVASAIQHPNVVRVYDAGEHADGVYLVMELVAGESLTAHLQRGKLSPRDAVDLIMPALRGIAAAHRNGVIHRDLKPDNLIVCKSAREHDKPVVKVLDFGLSKLIGPAADSLLTLPGMLVGTPQYMAPEQADSRVGAVSERSDIYTLATILYEAIAGRRPFESETLAGSLMKVAHEPPTPLTELADVPEEFADAVMWALERNPTDRPSNVEEFALALERFGTVAFADSGRMSDTKVSVRPRKPSDRAPAPHSVRAPAPQSAPGSPPPAHVAPAPRRPSKPIALWITGGALILAGSAALAYQHAKGADQAAAAAPPTEASPEPPRPAPPAPSPPESARPAAAAPVLAPTRSDAGTPSESKAPDPPAKQARAATRPAAARAPQHVAPAVAEPPPEPDNAAPTRAHRPKSSPGVADPWAE